jgi:hypothetical protein
MGTLERVDHYITDLESVRSQQTRHRVEISKKGRAIPIMPDSNGPLTFTNFDICFAFPEEYFFSVESNFYMLPCETVIAGAELATAPRGRPYKRAEGLAE